MKINSAFEACNRLMTLTRLTRLTRLFHCLPPYVLASVAPAPSTGPANRSKRRYLANLAMHLAMRLELSPTAVRSRRLFSSDGRSGRAPQVLLLVLLATASALSSAAEDTTTKAPLGISETRRALIDTRMREAVDAGLMSGAQALVAQQGKVLLRAEWGFADRESQTGFTDNTLFRIYSMSKPVTSVALLTLYEQGHFLLGDPVAKYLPEFKDLKRLAVDEQGREILVTPARPPTIRDLLRHTAGLTYGIFGNTSVDQRYRKADLLRVPDLATFTSKLSELPLQYDPGSRWHYSVSVDVQGRLIEVLSGKSFGAYLKQMIFEPLAMTSTGFRVGEDRTADLAQLYTPAGANMDWGSVYPDTTESSLEVADPALTKPYLEGGTFESGGAGLVSTLDDYLRFAQMLANGGELDGVRILSPQTVKLLRSDHLAGIDASGLWSMDGFGLGVGVINDPAGRSGELGGSGTYGWGGAAGTDFWIDPENSVVGVFMIQSIPHRTTLSEIFRNMIYASLLPASPE